MKKEIRADSFGVKSIADKIDGNGYLRIKGTFTRAGLFKYLQPDGSWRTELRHPDDVMRADSINTLKLVPIAPLFDHNLTNDQKQLPNDTDKFKSIGVTGENIATTSDAALDGTLTIHDKQTIQELLAKDLSNNPLPQISAAYTFPGLDKTPGFFDGSKWGIESGNYDAKQMGPFAYGHITLVPNGRAGSRCQARADTAQDKPTKKEKVVDKIKLNALEIGSGEHQFRADSIEIEKGEGTSILIARGEQLEEALKSSQVRADKADGEISVLQKDKVELTEKLEKSMSDEQYRADLAESLKMLDMAKEAGLELDKDDITPKAITMKFIEHFAPDDKVRADTDEGFRAGVFSQISKDFQHRVSRKKTEEGLKLFQDKLDDAPSAGGGYKDYGTLQN